MIDVDRYQKLKEKYGACSSWTIWKECFERKYSKLTKREINIYF